MSDFEAVIGLEVHAQLLTKTKMFCRCDASYGASPNTSTCPVCLGLPGALPVLNKAAIVKSLEVAMMMDCKIHKQSVFSRKNYFYPDLPKGYQISQYEKPLATDGKIQIELGGKAKFIRIRRIHLEEDAGKSFHEGFSDSGDKTYIDFNRSGVPLIEIVSEPDMKSPDEAYKYLMRLKSILTYLNVCTGRMEEGALRCDANISIRKKGESGLGTKQEVKNLNSFRNVEKAIEYEIKRQEKIISDGGRLRQETRLFDAGKGETMLMRVKEGADDYRYFPEPDLPPLILDGKLIDEASSHLVEGPAERKTRYINIWGLPEYDSDLLTETVELSNYFEGVVLESNSPKSASNLIMGEVMRFINDRGVPISDFPVSSKNLGILIKMVEAGTISNKMAKDIFLRMTDKGESPEEIVEKMGLKQVSDTSLIEDIIKKVLNKNPGPLAEYRAGKEKAFGFFVGQVMKETKGQANPNIVTEILKRHLSKSGK